MEYTFECFDIKNDVWIIIECDTKEEAERYQDKYLMLGNRYDSIGYEVRNINILQD